MSVFIPELLTLTPSIAETEKFFDKALVKFKVTSPKQLKGDKEKEFYDYVDKGWKADNETD